MEEFFVKHYKEITVFYFYDSEQNNDKGFLSSLIGIFSSSNEEDDDQEIMETLNSEYPVMRIDVSREELKELAINVGVIQYPWVLIYHEDHEIVNAKPTLSTAEEIEGKLLDTVVQMNKEKMRYKQFPRQIEFDNEHAKSQIREVDLTPYTQHGSRVAPTQEDLSWNQQHPNSEMTHVDLNPYLPSNAPVESETIEVDFSSNLQKYKEVKSTDEIFPNQSDYNSQVKPVSLTDNTSRTSSQPRAKPQGAVRGSLRSRSQDSPYSRARSRGTYR
uniref:Thioredoxin domain-containing protein n=1 Tax=Euplotes crassus TaxID=5936 RepID=A0A7S3KCT8_EUPCR|mmetsp:Transcript_21098/g.20788  ORF Transcript_21098/g.20788 Transcript_21098/m.20788 type:complete len:273 (+) Transcript_21098:90-908(+)